jgi:hypothetical protein
MRCSTVSHEMMRLAYSREIKRNGGQDGYRANRADTAAVGKLQDLRRPDARKWRQSPLLWCPRQG